MRRPDLPRPPVAIDYPTSDGKPLAENDPQLHAIHYAFGALLLRYAAHPDVYVSGDLLSHAEEHAACRAALGRVEQEAAARRIALARAEAAEARVAELEARLRKGR